MASRPPRETDPGEDAPAHWLFFREWLKAPLATASMLPSSRALADAMVRCLPEDARQVVELGPGTGVFTTALLRRGIDPQALLVVELNAIMHRNLARRFPQLRIVHGDARDLALIVEAEAGFARGEIDGIVSGLGFLAMPDVVVEAILAACVAVLRPGAPLVVFTYGPQVPVRRRILDRLHLVARHRAFVVRNLPPASVYELRRLP